MKKNLKKSWKELMSNRGSGLAVVMMAMVLLALLAAALLNMTYMGYKIKAEDRQQRVDYNTVSSAMNEIKAGLQDITSEAISDAYKNMLVNYDIAYANIEDNFKSYFLEKCRDQLKYNDFLSDIYNAATLKNMITISGNFVIANGDLKVEDKEIILHDISLTYTNSVGNKVKVKTDIVILAPDFSPIEGWNYDELVQYRNWSINKWT